MSFSSSPMEPAIVCDGCGLQRLIKEASEPCPRCEGLARAMRGDDGHMEGGGRGGDGNAMAGHPGAHAGWPQVPARRHRGGVVMARLGISLVIWIVLGASALLSAGIPPGVGNDKLFILWHLSTFLLPVWVLLGALR